MQTRGCGKHLNCHWLLKILWCHGGVPNQLFCIVHKMHHGRFIWFTFIVKLQNWIPFPMILPSNDFQGPLDYNHGSWFVCKATLNYKGFTNASNQPRACSTLRCLCFLIWLRTTSIISSSLMTNPTTPSNTKLRYSKQSNMLLNALQPPLKPTPKEETEHACI